MQELVAYLAPLTDPRSSCRSIVVHDLGSLGDVIARGTIQDWHISTVRQWCERHGFAVSRRLLDGFAYSLLRA